MYDEVVRNTRFPEALLALDRELGRVTQEEGCPRCGAALDAGHYARKPRGGPWALDQEQSTRLSYCCRRDGCRRRRMPPSVRFLGRRVYVGAVVVLAAVLRQGTTPWRVERLQAVLGVDRRTLVRWQRWWTTELAASRPFTLGRADFMPPPATEALPTSLLECFVGSAADKLMAALRWLAQQFGPRFPGDRHRSADDAR